jgi:hypothetical protein
MNNHGIDPSTRLTVPFLVNALFMKWVYIPYGNFFVVGCIVRDFMKGAIYGGRTMTAFNKKQHTTIPLADFDACSLYPSAMVRLQVPTGKPRVPLTSDVDPTVIWGQVKILREVCSYIVRIQIYEVGI